MMQEPPHLEIFLTKLAFFLCGKTVYQSFANRLPLKGNESVLDFGCGMGTVAYYVAKKIPRGHLTCLDISERWLLACRKTLRRYENVTYLLAESTSLSKDSFDIVYCHFVLHDISKNEIGIVLSSLVNSLKPCGVFAFREPLEEAEIISVNKRQIEQNGLSLQDSRIINIPLMGKTIESIYTK